MFMKLITKSPSLLKYVSSFMAFLLVVSTVFAANVFAENLSKHNVETINLGTAKYFGIIAEESVTNYTHCPTNVLANNLTTGTIGYDRSGKDMLGDEYPQGIGVIYITGKFDFTGGQVFASKLFLNSNYLSFVEYNQRYLVNDLANISIGTNSQCRAFYNIGSDDDKTGINLPGIFVDLKSLANDLSSKNDKGVNINGNNILVTNNAENIMTIDESWSWKTMFISNQNFKSTNSTLLVNVKLADGTKEFNLSQVKAGYSAYDNTDALVINFGDFDGTIYLNETSGTILAPNADIVVASGDHHGRVIGQNVIVKSEVHFIPSYDIPVKETTTSDEDSTTTTTSDEDSTTTTSDEDSTTTSDEDSTTTSDEDSTTTSDEDSTTTTSDEDSTTTTSDEDSTTTTSDEDSTTTSDEDSTTTSTSDEDSTTTTSDEDSTTTSDEDSTTTTSDEDSTTTTSDEDSTTTSDENSTTTTSDKEERTTLGEESTTPEEETTTLEETIELETDPIPLDNNATNNLDDNKEAANNLDEDNEVIIILDEEIALDGGAPTTGDNNNIEIFVVAAVLGLAIVVVSNKKAFKKN